MNIVLEKTIGNEDINKLPRYSFEGEIRIIDREEDVEPAINEIKKANILGFDTETKPSFRKHEANLPCLIQIAAGNTVYLFRINKCGFPQTFDEIFSNKDILKVGVGIRDDIKNLNKIRKFTSVSFLDLQNYVEKFEIEEKSFSKLMAIIFGVKISKRQRVTNWAVEKLSQPQIHYAATDAWGALKMFEKLHILETSEK